MGKYNDLYIKYIHPSCILYKGAAISNCRTYCLQEVIDEYKDIKFIQEMFSPIDFKWNDIAVTKKNGRKSKEKETG